MCSFRCRDRSGASDHEEGSRKGTGAVDVVPLARDNRAARAGHDAVRIREGGDDGHWNLEGAHRVGHAGDCKAPCDRHAGGPRRARCSAEASGMPSNGHAQPAQGADRGPHDGEVGRD